MKRLAAALACVLAGPAAYAQSSSVTLYGLVDTGVRMDRTTVGSNWSVGGGMGSGSRWGLRGAEDLGGGLRAIFTLESGFGADTGASGQGGLLFGRQAFVGLSGGFGTLTMGRQYSPMFVATLAMDTLEYGTIGNINNIYTRVVLRNNNAVNYVSPKIAGFEGRVLYAPGEASTPGAPKSAGNQLGASLSFATGGLLLNYAYHEIKGTNSPTATPPVVSDTPKEKQNQLGAAYNFGLAKLSTSYATFKNDAATSRVDFRNWWVALDGKITSSSTWMATYGKIDDRSGADRDANLMALCLMYHLSRRTDLHAAVARMSNNANSQYLITLTRPTPGCKRSPTCLWATTRPRSRSGSGIGSERGELPAPGLPQVRAGTCGGAIHRRLFEADARNTDVRHACWSASCAIDVPPATPSRL